MISDAAFQQLCQVVADEKFLLCAELERVGGGQLAREVGGHGFGGLSAWGKDEERSKVFGESFGNQTRPITANLARDMIAQLVGVNFLERHWSMVVTNQHGLSAKAVEPFDD